MDYQEAHLRVQTVMCPSCGATLDATLGRSKDDYEPITWSCPSCHAAHLTLFGGSELIDIIRHDESPGVVESD